LRKKSDGSNALELNSLLPSIHESGSMCDAQATHINHARG